MKKGMIMGWQIVMIVLALLALILYGAGVKLFGETAEAGYEQFAIPCALHGSMVGSFEDFQRDISKNLGGPQNERAYYLYKQFRQCKEAGFFGDQELLTVGGLKESDINELALRYDKEMAE